MRLLSYPESSSRYSRRKEDQTVFSEETDDLPDAAIKKNPKKPGHMKADCPKLKKRSFPNRRKKKNLLATWEDEDSSDSTDRSDAEVANICLMANDDQQIHEVNFVSSDTDSSESDDSGSDDKDLPYDLLLEQSHMIALEYKKCKAKLKAALLENQKLKQSNEKNVQEL